jgi:hypothetical protein
MKTDNENISSAPASSTLRTLALTQVDVDALSDALLLLLAKLATLQTDLQAMGLTCTELEERRRAVLLLHKRVLDT